MRVFLTEEAHRLKRGTWGGVGADAEDGDIAASYSADRIGEGKPIRKPFRWRGAVWSCVACGCVKGAREEFEAYRLTPVDVFAGTPTNYAARAQNGDLARDDPRGFYHGVQVKTGKLSFVMTGPPITILEGGLKNANDSGTTDEMPAV